MPGMVLFHGSISDAAATLALRARQNFDGDYPFAFGLDLDTWSMTLDNAARLAASGGFGSKIGSIVRLGEAKRQRRGRSFRGRSNSATRPLGSNSASSRSRRASV